MELFISCFCGISCFCEIGEKESHCISVSVLVPCSLSCRSRETLKWFMCGVLDKPISTLAQAPIQVHEFHCIPRSRQRGGKPRIQDWCSVLTISWGMGGKEERSTYVLGRSVTHCIIVWYCSSSWSLCRLVCILSIHISHILTLPHTVQKGSWSMQRSSLDNCSD